MLDRLDDPLPRIFPRNLGLQLVSEDVNVSALQNMISTLDLENGRIGKLKGPHKRIIRCSSPPIFSECKSPLNSIRYSKPFKWWVAISGLPQVIYRKVREKGFCRTYGLHYTSASVIAATAPTVPSSVAFAGSPSLSLMIRIASTLW